MTLVKWNNTNRLNHFFDDFYGRDLVRNSYARVPAANIKESQEGYEILLAAAGFEKENFKIVVENNNLKISAEKEAKTDEKYTLKEFSSVSFERSFVLPNTVDSEAIQAKYENGILKVHIPKKAEAKEKAAKTIEIG